MESNLIAEKIIAGLIQLKEYFNGANVVDHLPIDIFFAYDFNEHTKCNWHRRHGQNIDIGIILGKYPCLARSFKH